MRCHSDRDVAGDSIRPHGLVLQRREQEAVFFEGPQGARAYVTVLEVDRGRAALKLDLPQVGSLVLFLDARAQGHAKLQIAAPASVQILRTECEQGRFPSPETQAACC